ncbi:competence/damage-inducible protein A [Tautonia plasticadhaerens]|uniref:CinA-like protein n=1 Tax=Tautonia plasticadhaerens TaxID=2527974 RepID=A0A518H6P4_9BACT|nr:competence/damage-inducible protein A [Tautonia plasticadhaerens]QDV36512.1 Nicotinamide-nucleotide amidohydrolase PncC [Tautonia plasticadhaerens]
MRAELLIIGSELTSGEKLDTNGQWLCTRLAELGVPVRFTTVIGDDLDDNIDAFKAASGRSDLVVSSGGLGPTQDDLTRDALAKAGGVGMVQDDEALRMIEALFARRDRPMPDRNRTQALIPEGSEILHNPTGTAPGIWMRLDRAWVACLPGVPRELKAMFDAELAPRLRASGLAGRVVLGRTINLFGLGESEAEQRAPDLTARGRIPEVGITASDATISFRIRAEGADEAEALALIGPTAEAIYERFGDFVVGEGTDDVAEGLVAALKSTGKTIALAESCTGGLIAHRITRVDGVSPHFPGGVVSYANGVKSTLLDVPADLIASKGAVSPEVAEAMAEGARRRLGADLGLAVTGVAGPAGGTPEKPVGLVYLGLADASGTRHRRLALGPEQPRAVIQSRASKHAMNWARLALLGKLP